MSDPDFEAAAVFVVVVAALAIVVGLLLGILIVTARS